MKKRLLNNGLMALVTAALVTISGMIEALPWWGFVIPVLLLGLVAAWKEWRLQSFPVGFFAGFLVWVLANMWFEKALHNQVLDRMALLLPASKFVVFLVAGLIGGLLTGLALYTGKTALLKTVRPNL